MASIQMRETADDARDFWIVFMAVCYTAADGSTRTLLAEPGQITHLK